MKKVLAALLAIIFLLPLGGCATSPEDFASSVVRIAIRDETGQMIRTGSGFVVGTKEIDGVTYQYVATNHHVVAESTSFVYIWRDRDTFIHCSEDDIIQQPLKDIAILRVEEPIEGAVPMRLGQEDWVRAGDTVYSLGFPGIEITDEPSGIPQEVTVTSGVIGKKTIYKGSRIYQHDCTLNRGSSGGPLITQNGVVIGINTLAAKDGEVITNTNGAYMIEYIYQLLEDRDIHYRRAFWFSLSNPLLWVYILVLVAIIIGVTLIVLGRRSIKRKKQAGAQFVTPVLRALSGPIKGYEVKMEEPIVLGRDPTICQLVFPQETPGVSRAHARVRFDPVQGVFLLEDASTHGTFLEDGERLTPGQARELHSGERFYLGESANRFEVFLKET